MSESNEPVLPKPFELPPYGDDENESMIEPDTKFTGGASDEKNAGKRSFTSLLCGLAFLLLLAWTAYTLYEIFMKSMADKKAKENNSQSENAQLSWLSHPQCGKIICHGDCKTRVRKLVGGVEAERGDWPWMVEIKINDRFTCGGVLLNKDYVLSAAHCFHSNKKKINEPDVQVYLGTNKRNLPETWRQQVSICNLEIHENFNPMTLENDLALLKLKQSANFSPYILPVCIPKHTEDRTGVIVGWGKEKPNGPYSPSLKQAEMPIVPLDVCKRQNNNIYRRVKVHSDMHLCVGHGKKSHEYACAGDSGGGFFQKRLGRWFLQGVVSWNDPSCNATIHDTYTVLTNVAKYTNWLGTYMDFNSNQ